MVVEMKREKKVRKIFLFKWPDESKVYCEACMTGPMAENNYDSCVELKEGNCCICEYEKGPEEIVLEKINKLKNEIQEAERMIEVIQKSSREIRIDQLTFHRNKEYEKEFKSLSDPKNIIRSLQFPITLDKETATEILKKQIKRREKEINSLSKKQNPV